jgi:DNA-directed RNA polymerase subunit F
MVHPNIIEEKPITLVELKEELTKIKKRDKELNFRSNKTYEYLQVFVKLTPAKAEELEKKLVKQDIPRLKDIHIKKIVDVLPQTLEDLKVILQGYTITVNNDNMKKIVQIVNEFLGTKKSEE